MATITPVTIDAAGEALTFAGASGGGDSIAGAAGATLVVKNGDVAGKTVTFTGAVTCSQGGTHNKAFTVAAGAEAHLPVPTQAVNPADGTAAVTYSAVTSVTVAAYKD